jgi:Cdc6-like AAA superfamily ATPase
MRIEATIDSLLTAADLGMTRNSQLDPCIYIFLDALKTLNPIGEARYDAYGSPTGCLQDTRTDILEQMLHWVKTPSKLLQVYWLAGLAGTGKSTIAKTFCEKLVALEIGFVCTFFVSKNSGDRRNPFRVLHTLVFELAQMYPTFRAALLAAIRAPPEVKTRSIEEQVKRLLWEPLRHARVHAVSHHSLVFVIDALDECKKIDDLEGGQLIPELANALGHFPVKLVITSRMERSLIDMFSCLPHKSLKLHEIGKDDVSSDVRRIWQKGFVDIVRDHNINTTSSHSRSQSSILHNIIEILKLSRPLHMTFSAYIHSL